MMSATYKGLLPAAFSDKVSALEWIRQFFSRLESCGLQIVTRNVMSKCGLSLGPTLVSQPCVITASHICHSQPQTGSTSREGKQVKQKLTSLVWKY